MSRPVLHLSSISSFNQARHSPIPVYRLSSYLFYIYHKLYKYPHDMSIDMDPRNMQFLVYCPSETKGVFNSIYMEHVIPLSLSISLPCPFSPPILQQAESRSRSRDPPLAYQSIVSTHLMLSIVRSLMPNPSIPRSPTMNCTSLTP